MIWLWHWGWLIGLLVVALLSPPGYGKITSPIRGLTRFSDLRLVLLIVGPWQSIGPSNARRSRPQSQDQVRGE
jgi:hypothetical protein